MTDIDEPDNCGCIELAAYLERLRREQARRPAS